jgi:SAM-dependent methyltransferase
MFHARAHSWETWGFEPGRRGLDTCRAAGLEVTDQIEKLPSGYFGLVTLHHVFEHLANPAESLDGIQRLLAPDGRLFVEVPNAGSLRARLALSILSQRLGVDERYRAFPIHLMYYVSQTLQEMLVKGGWSVDAMFTLGLGLDEFVIRPERSALRKTEPGEGIMARPLPRRRFRHALRDAFLSLGLGENLAVIAHL